jgi:carboxypeptidase C (cathepsin A)
LLRIYNSSGLDPSGNTLNIYDIYGPCYHQSSPLGGIPPCSDAIGALTFTGNADVQKALNIRNNTNNWTMCNDSIGANYINDDRASYWIYEELLGKYRVLVYSGDADGAVPITGTLNWIEKLRTSKGLSVVRPWSPWSYPGLFNDKQVGGFVEVLDNDFTFVSIRGAGHMVPQFYPQPAYVFMSNWIAGNPLPGF